jgi:hypothetical protein
MELLFMLLRSFQKISFSVPKKNFSTLSRKQIFPQQYSVPKSFIDNAYWKLLNSKDDEAVQMIDESPYRYNVPLQKFKVEILRRKIIQHYIDEKPLEASHLKNILENEKQTLNYIHKQLKSNYEPILPLASSLKQLEESLNFRVKKYHFQKDAKPNLVELGCYRIYQELYPINFAEPIPDVEEPNVKK